MHEGKAYYWYIAPNYENPRLWKNFDVLHIAAEDKSLVLNTPLEFMEPVPDAVTPALVKQIIEEELRCKEKSERKPYGTTGISGCTGRRAAL